MFEKLIGLVQSGQETSGYAIAAGNPEYKRARPPPSDAEKTKNLRDEKYILWKW